MDFAKFVSLLQTKSLWFARPDTLGDNYEGSLPIFNAKERDRFALDRFNNKDFLRRLVAHNLLPKSTESMSDDEFVKMSTAGQKAANRFFTLSSFISCWHMNQGESAAMWKIYSDTPNGLAIQSQFGDLCEAFSATPKSVYIGAVRYIDYSEDRIESHNAFGPILHKRKSFAHESELRAVVFEPERFLVAAGNGFEVDSEALKSLTGIGVSVDVKKLIKRVVLHPGSPEWFASVVRTTLEASGLESSVDRSDFDLPPLD